MFLASLLWFLSLCSLDRKEFPVKKIAAIIALAGLAGVVNAQTYTIETRWVAVTTTAAQGAVGTQLANNTVVDKSQSGRISVNRGADANAVAFAQRMELQARVTATGQNNLGVFAVRGNIAASLSENALANAGQRTTLGLGDRTPFTFGPATEQFRDGGAASTAARIDEIFNLSADLNAFPAATWNLGSPQPTAPAANGVGPNWVSVYRILLEVTNGSADRVFNVNFVHSDSRGIQSWSTVPDPVLPPDEDNPARVFNYLGLQMTGTRTQVDSSFAVSVVPAPASVALVGLGGLVAARRRRA
jgi:hypothetical protein